MRYIEREFLKIMPEYFWTHRRFKNAHLAEWRVFGLSKTFLIRYWSTQTTAMLNSRRD